MSQGVVGVFYIALIGYTLAFTYVLFLILESHTFQTPTSHSDRDSKPTGTALLHNLTELKQSLQSTLQLFTPTTLTGTTTSLLITILFLITIGYGSDNIF